MLPPFDNLQSEYNIDWTTGLVKPERQHEALGVADRLLKDKAVYMALEDETGVPALWSMPTNERESSGSLRTYLGNGDPLNQVTRDVPRGRGPFSTWPAGAKDALALDGISAVKVWNPARLCYEWELFNGFGYRARGIRSPYLVGGTVLQQPGKFIRDGVFSTTEEDSQLGCIAVAWALLQRSPDLALSTGGLPALSGAPIILPPSPPPMTVGGSHHDTSWLQAALNQIASQETNFAELVDEAGGPDQLRVDGAYGRQTRLFVRAFEQAEGLTVDRGFVGPQVYGAIDKLLGTGWVPPTTQ